MWTLTDEVDWDQVSRTYRNILSYCLANGVEPLSMELARIETEEGMPVCSSCLKEGQLLATMAAEARSEFGARTRTLLVALSLPLCFDCATSLKASLPDSNSSASARRVSEVGG